MSTVYGVNRTKYRDAIGSNLVSSGTNKGQVCSMSDTYEASSLPDGDLIEVCDALPIGAIVTRVMIMSDDMGSTVTLALGDADDDNRYITATSVTVANDILAINTIGGVGYEVTGTDDTQLAILGAGILNGTIKITVEYTV